MYRLKNIILGLIMVCSIPIYFLLGSLPRKKDIWLFSAWQGNKYRGKTRYFFEYMSSVHSGEVRSVWITNDKEVRNRIRKDGNLCYKMMSLQGIFLQIRSSCFFVSHGSVDFIPFLSKSAKVVKLGHATYPIKKSGVSDFINKCSLVKKLYLWTAVPYSYLLKNLVDYEVASSEESAQKSGAIYQNPELKVLPLGSSKVEYLRSLSTDRLSVLSEIAGEPPFSVNKLIVFFPTWRADDEFCIFDHGFDLQRFQFELEQNSAVLLVSFHPYDVEKRKHQLPISPRIIHFEPKGDEVDRILAVTDVFVTDFSSLFADFLIFDRPMIFAQFDKNGYVDKNMEIDLLPEQLPGAVVEDWKALENHLFISIDQTDNFLSCRKQWINRVYGNSSIDANKKIFDYFYEET